MMIEMRWALAAVPLVALAVGCAEPLSEPANSLPADGGNVSPAVEVAPQDAVDSADTAAGIAAGDNQFSLDEATPPFGQPVDNADEAATDTASPDEPPKKSAIRSLFRALRNGAANAVSEEPQSEPGPAGAAGGSGEAP